MAKKLTVVELQTLEAQCTNLMGWLGMVVSNINIMAETNVTRELSMVRTKVDEAMMWLDRYQAGVCIDLANKTCQ